MRSTLAKVTSPHARAGHAVQYLRLFHYRYHFDARMLNWDDIGRIVPKDLWYPYPYRIKDR
jgi:hypothetical protein